MVDLCLQKKKSVEKKRKLISSNQPNSESAKYSNEDIEKQASENNKKIKLNGGPWRNLVFVSSIEGTELDNQRKLELALEYVNSSKCSDDYDGGDCVQMVSDFRSVLSLNKWVQSLLNDDPTQWEDFNVWEIFKFCLQKSLYLRVQLTFNSKILHIITCIGENLALLSDERCELYSLVLDCLTLLFTSSHGRVFIANMDTWSLTVASLLDVLHKVYLVKVSNDKVGILLIRLSCLIFDRYTNFLMAHPKKVFRKFLDKLLEPLLSFLVMMSQIDGCNSTLTKELLKTVEDVLSYGLFHPDHVNEFLSLPTTERGIEFGDGKRKESKMRNVSYGIRLFEKLENIISEKRISSLGSVGELFRLFVFRVKKEKGVPVLSDGIQITTRTGILGQLGNVTASSKSNFSVGHGQAVTEIAHSRLDMETGKSVFNIFLWFIIPLKREIETYNKTSTEEGLLLLDAARCTLEATNRIIASFMHEKVYLRTEDTSDGERLIFLKGLYLTVISFSQRIRMWLPGLTNESPANGASLVAKEIIVSLGYLLEIEYEVAGEDLVRLWEIILSFLVIDLPKTGSPKTSSLASQVLHFGCQLININSELRQVCDSLFALCKAVRSLAISNCEECVKSVTTLLCFQEFRVAVCKAIKNIPEGKATECIERLKKDVSESLDWMMISSSKGKKCREENIDMQVELLGRALPEAYTLLLDNLAVTTGNSKSVRHSIQDLVIVLGSFLSILVGKEHSNVSGFLLSVTGQRYLSEEKITRSSASWISLFFFRIYASCRSLNKQLISLMPPDSSEQASNAMGDFLTACAGENCMENTDLRDHGYFSWIIRPSDSLLIIIQSIEDFCGRDTIESCAPLVYVMHTMAYQRLADLSRQIKAFRFIQKEQNNTMSMSDAVSHLLCEEIKILRKEAKDLTVYLMEKIELMCADGCINSDGKEQQNSPEDDAWDLCIPSMDEGSLPTAVWYLLCQNADIWGPYATREKLKKFLFLLFHTTPARARSRGNDVIKDKMEQSHNIEKITRYEISMELVHDTTFYEHTFLCRYLSSSFSGVLRQHLLSLSADPLSGDVDFDNWLVDLSKFEKVSIDINNSRRPPGSKLLPIMKRHSVHPNPPFTKCTKNLIACRSLLNLLCWMPKVYLKSKSFSDCATNVLNLERVLVSTIVKNHGKLKVDIHFEFFRLFVCCRKALKCLLTSFHDDSGEAVQYSVVQIFIKNSYSVLWLWKSITALIQLLPPFPEEHASELKHMIPSLMDDTSHILLTLTKEHFTLSIPSAINNADLIQELPISDGTSRERSWSESDPSLGAWMEHVTDSLQEHAKSFLPIKTGLNSGDLNSLSSVVTCFHGFLWGITSILRDKYEKDSEEHDLLLSWLSSWSKDTTDSKLKMFITFTEDFINSCLSALLVVNSQQPTCSEKDFAEGSRSIKKLSRSGKNAGFTIDILIERQLLNKPLLQRSLKVDNPELAFCVRQLLIGSSAILSLKIQISRRACFSSSMPILIRTSQYLLTEFANIVQEPHSVSYICLAGAVKYLEVLGSYVSSRAKDSFKNVYAMLIDIHLQAMGRCISLCGKEATLASHEIESSTKTLVGQTGPPKSSAGHRWNFLREFRARLRLSFNALVRKDSKLRRTTAITAIERALGVREQCSMVYEIYAEGPDGGKVSDTVAAGVDCFDSVVQSVSGPSSLKKHIKGLTGALFNIVLHLQGPQIFYEKVTCNGEDASPDPGAVILMCVEVLIKVFGKPKRFQMDSDHVVQSLRLPGALFKGFCYRRHSGTSPDPAVVSPDQMFSPACARLCNMDTRFSVDLFAACCRLLSTVIRLHSSATKMAVAILQDSVSVLLHCLETRDVELVYENGYSTWEVQEGRICASFLCRVYEQIKLKKEDFERETLSFLSEYICVYSGLGPSKTGIRREIDEALKPGIYALVDACSEDDLQTLHTVLEDGPCTGTLKTLVQDYKQNYHYGGKA